jgi:hypothetical protein
MDGDWQRGDPQMSSHYAAVHESAAGTTRKDFRGHQIRQLSDQVCSDLCLLRSH